MTPLPGGPSQHGALGHQRIYDAVAAGDADGAAGAMEEHLRYFEARLDAGYAGWRRLPVAAAE